MARPHGRKVECHLILKIIIVNCFKTITTLSTELKYAPLYQSLLWFSVKLLLAPPWFCYCFLKPVVSPDKKACTVMATKQHKIGNTLPPLISERTSVLSRSSDCEPLDALDLSTGFNSSSFRIRLGSLKPSPSWVTKQNNSTKWMLQQGLRMRWAARA